MEHPNLLPKVPLSLDNYIELYHDPRVYTFKLRLNHATNMHEQASMIGEVAGCLFVEAAIYKNYFRLPLQLI